MLTTTNYKKGSPGYATQALMRLREKPTSTDLAIVLYSYMTHRASGKQKLYRSVQCLLTKDELQAFIESVWDDYIVQYNVWKANNYSRRFVPSIDRIDSAKHYSLDNIQIVPFYQNASRATLGRKQSEQHIKKRSEALIEYNKNRP